MGPSFLYIWLWSLSTICSAISSFPQCCSHPVESFILPAFSGPCACQTLQQKWRRFVDWVEMEGGYVHPSIELNYLSEFQNNNTSKLPSYEKGVFANIQSGNRTVIQPKELMFQIPFPISFSPFIISKYIKKSNNSNSHDSNDTNHSSLASETPDIIDILYGIDDTPDNISDFVHSLFPEPDHFMPSVY